MNEAYYSAGGHLSHCSDFPQRVLLITAILSMQETYYLQLDICHNPRIFPQMVLLITTRVSVILLPFSSHIKKKTRAQHLLLDSGDP
jgi:hypothetical protein